MKQTKFPLAIRNLSYVRTLHNRMLSSKTMPFSKPPRSLWRWNWTLPMEWHQQPCNPTIAASANQNLPEIKALITSGVLSAKPQTSNIPPSFGSATVKPLLISATIRSFAAILVFGQKRKNTVLLLKIISVKCFSGAKVEETIKQKLKRGNLSVWISDPSKWEWLTARR